jgi:C1A family cysteine protease
MRIKSVILFLFLDFNNYKPQNSGIPASSRPRLASALFASPSAFDWRTYGVVTPIKDQGSCGSCWAFSTTAEYESKIAIATNGVLYDLSEQYVLKC